MKKIKTLLQKNAWFLIPIALLICWVAFSLAIYVLTASAYITIVFSFALALLLFFRFTDIIVIVIALILASIAFYLLGNAQIYIITGELLLAGLFVLMIKSFKRQS